MDLGALLCRPAVPACGECPVRPMCAWAGGDDPDPAVGSSGVSGRQGRFDGSDRQARGRLMQALTAGPVDRAGVAEIMQRDVSVAERLVRDLAAEGLCLATPTTLTLP
jgi:A/G-specific adenine glycosylase